MKGASNFILAIAIAVAEMAAVGLTIPPASAQETTAKKIKDQRRLLLQQQRQLEQNQRRLDAQRRELARQGTAGTPGQAVRSDQAVPSGQAVSHGLFGDCPLGFTYYLVVGCQPDHAVIIYNGGSLGGLN